jgi:hypothetical protein
MSDNGAGGGGPVKATYPTSPPLPIWNPPLITDSIPSPSPPPPPTSNSVPTNSVPTNNNNDNNNNCVYTGCELPFYIKHKKTTKYSEPITVAKYRPYGSAALASTALWCPLTGVKTYSASSASVKSSWKQITCS